MKAIVFFISLSLASSLAFSATVVKKKGPAVLIKDEFSELKKQSLYYTVVNSKKYGIVKVLKLATGKAIAKVLKGKAPIGSKLVLRKSKKKNTTQVKVKKAPAPKRSVYKKQRRKKRTYSNKGKIGLGLNIGYQSSSSDVDFFKGSTFVRSDSYTGSSMSYEGFLDYRLSRKLGLRASLGMHNFLTEDAANKQCLDSNNQVGAVCSIDLTYFNLDIWGKYKLTSSWHNLWVGAGAGILFSPKINSTTALEEGDLGATAIAQIGAGADIKISESLYVPITLEYDHYPSSATVKMSSIGFYFGLGLKL